MRVERKVSAAVATLVLTLALAGCTQQPSPEAATTTTTTTPTLIATGDVPTVANDLATNSAHHTLPVDGEQFSLNVDYWTDYDAAAWQTLQPKKVNLSVHLAPTATTAGDAPEVLIGSFTAVTTLLAAMPGLDGLPIAMSNQDPTAIPGYLINVNYPYDNVLAIQGFSDELATRWQTVAGDQPLTQPGLVAAGVYGNRITFSYRVLVKNTGDAGYHQRILQDTLTMAEAASPATPAETGAAASTPAG
ncbi:MAG: hypothetical protein ABWZ98_09530 [Nakamurella sp.]